MQLIRAQVRRVMRSVAQALDTLSGHRLTPNAVTIAAAVAHIFIALLIAWQKYWWAAALLLVFGLFDTLDGELARLQNRASPAGMLLDASLDRFKETLLYIGCAYSLAMSAQPVLAVTAVAACGASICVSYVKAKGEAAISTLGKPLPHAQLNRLFSDGLAPFEIRMVILLLGLVSARLALALYIIAALAGFTALQRLYRISRVLNRGQA